MTGRPDDDHSRLRDRRVQYETAGLERADLHADPVVQWQRWHDEAFEAGVAEPNALTLATVDVDGAAEAPIVPDARIVLVRSADDRGLTFFTNYRSPKSRQLDVTPTAAGVFAWLDLHRQVRVRGTVVRVAASESDEYFASRPRDSQLGAWASPQSNGIADRAELEHFLAEIAARYDGAGVPRPPHWGGWRLDPTEWEFWQGRPSRLHDRFRYRRTGPDPTADWHISRLAP